MMMLVFCPISYPSDRFLKANTTLIMREHPEIKRNPYNKYLIGIVNEETVDKIQELRKQLSELSESV